MAGMQPSQAMQFYVEGIERSLREEMGSVIADAKARQGNVGVARWKELRKTFGIVLEGESSTAAAAAAPAAETVSKELEAAMRLARRKECKKRAY
eukprot:634070-Lingulodinium_polyedra.AAC.1